MLERLAADTGVIAYLMAAAGICGVLAKIVNQLTLHRLLRAAGNMPKSTHRLIKLVRSKYEHACMIRDSVENVDAFVEKYIYEYRGFLFRIHTWRQIEILSVWFAGILAALGASVLYFSSGFSESVYQYIAAGAVETVLLAVVMRLTDEPYKIGALKMYMTDYLENICTFQLRRQGSRERESIDVIAAEGSGRGVRTAEAGADRRKQEKTEGRIAKRALRTVTPARADAYQTEDISGREEKQARPAADSTANAAADPVPAPPEQPSDERAGGGLPINIEGEPRYRQEEERTDQEHPALREEAIRQILEEFLA